jgi:hypothetical protein
VHVLLYILLDVMRIREKVEISGVMRSHLAQAYISNALADAYS